MHRAIHDKYHDLCCEYLLFGAKKLVKLKVDRTKFAVQIHSDLNDQNLFHSTIDVPPGVSKYLNDQTEVHSAESFGELEC